MEIEYVEYNEIKHLDELAKLEQYLWKGRSESDLKNIFKWKYQKSDNISNAFVALDQGKLVAFRGFFINRYKVQNKILPIAVFADTVTHPSYRGKGLFSILSKIGIEFLREHGVIGVLALSSNEKSSPGYLKLGCGVLTEKETSYRLLISSILPYKQFKIQNFNKRKERNSIKIATFDGMTEELATELAVFTDKHQHEAISLVMDYDFWMQRYAAPHWHYKFTLLYKNDILSGYVVYREVLTGKISHVKILDVNVIKSDYFKYLIQSVEYQTSCKLMTMYTTCFNCENMTNMRKMFPLKKTGNKSNASTCILFKKLSGDMDDSFFLRKENWKLSYIDLDNM